MDAHEVHVPRFGRLEDDEPEEEADEPALLLDDERVVAELVEEDRMGEVRHRSAPPTVDDLDDLVEVAFGDLTGLHESLSLSQLPAERKAACRRGPARRRRLVW